MDGGAGSGNLFAEFGDRGLWFHNDKVDYYYGADHFNTTAVSLNSWHHIVVSVNAGNVTFYLDGAADGTATGAVSINANAIGQDFSGGESFQGYMDDVRIYNRALSGSEVTDLYQEGGGVSVPLDTQPPTAPSNVSSSGISSSAATISWSASSDNVAVTGYKIYRNGSQVGSVGGTSFTDSGLSASTNYSYTVSAHDAAGNDSSQSSPALSVTTSANVGFVTAPSNLQVSESYDANTTPQQIEFYLRWTDAISDRDGFQVQESIDGGAYTTVQTAAGLSYIGRAEPIKDYKFRIVAYKDGTLSSPSTPIEFTGLMQANYLDVQSTTTNSATITFTNRNGSGVGYQIERSDDNGANYTVLAHQNADTLGYIPYGEHTDTCQTCTKIFVDSGLTPGHTYYYRVAPYNDAGFGPYAQDSNISQSTGPWFGRVSIAPGGAPIAPGLSAELRQGPLAHVTLVDDSNNEKFFDIERSTNDVNWTNLCTFSYGTGDKSCDDTNVVPSTTYYYRALARNDAASSTYAYTDPVVVSGVPSDPMHTFAWYVWKNAPGTDNGESWANAWKDLDHIDWSVIKPGDTIYISGDTYAKALSIGASGLQGNPIKIETGARAPDPSGHSGRVVMQNIVFQSGRTWVTIDGSLNPNFVPDTALDNLDGNINMEVNGSPAYGIHSSVPVGLSFRFMEITNTTGGGIEFTGPVDYVSIYGLHISYTGAEGIFMTNGAVRQAYDGAVISKTLIEYTGDDCIFTGGSTTVSGSILRYINPFGSGGHPDYIQGLNSNYLDVHDTSFYDRTQSSYMIDNESAIPTDTVPWGHIRIYNNLLYYSDQNLAPVTEGIYFLASDNLGYNGQAPGSYFIPEVRWDDILVANNTFYNLKQTIPVNMNVRPEVGRVDATNVSVKNNIIYDSSPGSVSFAVNPNIHFDRTYAGFLLPNFAFDNNVVAADSSSLGSIVIGFHSSTYNTVEDLDASSHDSTVEFLSNSSIAPKFSNLSAPDFHLSSLDTAAAGKGANLSQYFTTDKDGDARPGSGSWDIGAFQGTGTGTVTDLTSGLVARWNFDADDFSTQRADQYSTIPFTDSSGNTNDADCQSAFVLNGTTYNQCPGKTTGPDGTFAAAFSGQQLCDNAADYLAIPRDASLDQLAHGTISLWIANGGNGDSDLNYRALDTQSSAPHTWVLHRDGDLYYTFTVNADSGQESDVITFPGGNAPAGSWNLLTITWDGSVIKGYYNGVFFGQTPMVGISSLDLSNYLAIGALMHGDFRNVDDGGNCIRQYGAAAGNYVFPNAGFFTGKMDDIRIYNRALSTLEVASLASAATVPPTQRMLSVIKSGAGYGAVGGGGIGCGKHCAESYDQGTSVILTAVPDAVSVFAGWSGACSGTGTCSVSMTSNRSVTAVFNRKYPTVATLAPASAVLATPFQLLGGTIFQNSDVSTAQTAGRATYTFTVPEQNDYYVVAKVNAPSGASNSFYVNVDSDPLVDESIAWYMNTTGGLEDRIVSWGGNTDGGNSPHAFTLSAGTHTLYVRGREAGTAIGSISILNQGGTVSNLPPVTLPPSILNPGVASVTASSAYITWDTDAAASTQVVYGLTSAYGSQTSLDSSAVTTHYQTLSGLAANTLYHYAVVSTNAGGTTRSADQTLTTSSSNSGGGGITYSSGGGGGYTAPTALTISNIKISGTVAAGLTVSWNTSVSATSQVQFGLTNAYGSQTALAPIFVSSHSVKIINLKPNTQYHFQARSKDSYGYLATSTDLVLIISPTGLVTLATPISTVGTAGAPAASNVNTPVVSISGSITTWLLLGTTNSQVKTLQQILNASGYPVASSGSGSRGNESTYFGPATDAALKKFQCTKLQVCSGGAYVTGYGATGPKTRNALNALGGNSVAPVNTTPVSNLIPVTLSKAVVPTGSITTWLLLGSTNTQVKTLQQILNAKGFLVASTGTGSPGHESTYFGPATDAALKKFQCAKLQVCSGAAYTTGYGATGPKTRSALSGR